MVIWYNMKLELYLQQWWGIQNFGRGNFTAYARVLVLWDRHCRIADNAGWNQAESEKGFLWIRQSLPLGLQFTWIARQLELCTVFTGNHGPKERAAKKEIAPRQRTAWTSECQQQSTISIAETWTLWRSHMRFWGTWLAKIKCKDMTAAHEKQV